MWWSMLWTTSMPGFMWMGVAFTSRNLYWSPVHWARSATHRWSSQVLQRTMVRRSSSRSLEPDMYRCSSIIFIFIYVQGHHEILLRSKHLCAHCTPSLTISITALPRHAVILRVSWKKHQQKQMLSWQMRTSEFLFVATSNLDI